MKNYRQALHDRALVGLLLAVAFVGLASGVEILFQNSTYAELKTASTFARINANKFEVSAILPNGQYSRPLSVAIYHIEERYKYRIAGGPCDGGSRLFSLSDWQLSINPNGPNGTTLATMTARFGPNNACIFRNRFYATDKEVTIISSSKPVIISPAEIKNSFIIENCSSIDNIADFLPGVDPATITVIGRAGGPTFNVSATAPTVANLFPIDQNIYEILTSNNDTLKDFWNGLCLSGDTYTNNLAPVPELPANHNYDKAVRFLFYLTEQDFSFQYGVKLLTWAFVDDNFYAEPSMNFDWGSDFGASLLYPEDLGNGLNRYTIGIKLRPVFHHVVDYDPSISVLFDTSTTTSPDATPGVLQESVVGTAVGAAVGAVAGVAVIALLVAFFVSPNFRRKVLPYSKRAPTTTTIEPLDDVVPSPAPQQQPDRATTQGGWVVADTDRTSVRNTIE